MSTGVYGFYKDGIMKVSSYTRESNPKSLGYALFNALYYAWPQELLYMFMMLKMVKASDKPTEEEYDSIMEAFGQSGFVLRKSREQITFYDLLSERQNDILALFIAVRHANLRHFIDGIENLKASGFCDWVYIYNLNLNRIEVYYRKEQQPNVRTISDDPYIYLEECFDLIHTMDHNPGDLGRNQFDLSGLDYAYDKVFNKK
jgi:hypothetical protein